MIARLRVGYDGLLRWAAMPVALWIVAAATLLAVLTPRIPAEVALVLALLPRAPKVWRAWGAAVLGCAIGCVWVVWWGTPIDANFPAEAVARATEMLRLHSWSALIIAGFVPTPFALFLTSAAPAGLSGVTIVVCAVVGRAVRYAVVALVLRQFGEWARLSIASHFREVVLVSLGAAIMWGIVR